MNLPTCHEYIRRKSQFPNIRDTGLAALLITGVEKSQIASGRRSVGKRCRALGEAGRVSPVGWPDPP
jgi:hypothetical protein